MFGSWALKSGEGAGCEMLVGCYFLILFRGSGSHFLTVVPFCSGWRPASGPRLAEARREPVRSRGFKRDHQAGAWPLVLVHQDDEVRSTMMQQLY